MKVKEGVSLAGVVWQMFAASLVVEEVYQERKLECVITSGSEGKHTNEQSLHYRGRALDYRIRDIPVREREGFCEAVRARVELRLGPGYEFVVKPDHMHGEYDPRMHGVN